MGMMIDPNMLMMLQKLMAGNQALGGGQSLQNLASASPPAGAGGGFMAGLQNAAPLLGLGSGVLQGIGGMIEGNKARKQAGKERDLQRHGMTIQQGANNVDGFQRLMQLLLASSQRGGM